MFITGPVFAYFPLSIFAVGDDARSTRFAPEFVLGFFPNGASSSELGEFGLIAQSKIMSSQIEATLQSPACNLYKTFSFNDKKKKALEGATYTSRTTGLNNGTIDLAFNYDTRVNVFSINTVVSNIKYLITLWAKCDYDRRLTHSIRDSETFIDFVQGPPGSRRERVNISLCEQASPMIHLR